MRFCQTLRCHKNVAGISAWAIFKVRWSQKSPKQNKISWLQAFHWTIWYKTYIIGKLFLRRSQYWKPLVKPFRIALSRGLPLWGSGVVNIKQLQVFYCRTGDKMYIVRKVFLRRCQRWFLLLKPLRFGCPRGCSLVSCGAANFKLLRVFLLHGMPWYLSCFKGIFKASPAVKSACKSVENWPC